MKKTILLLLFITVLYSCKNTESKEEINIEKSSPIIKLADQKIKKFSGDFIFTADAAVIKGANFIYGVHIDEMATELADLVSPAKNTDFDMVYVVVTGEVSQKPEGQEGWDEILIIHEIISVSDKPAKIDLNIEETKN